MRALGLGGWTAVLLVAAMLLGACTSESGWDWDLPSGFPEPAVPEDNSMSAEKIELGRRLFYERRLSGNGTQSCATCHRQELAFTDGRPRAVGSTGDEHPRAAMSLTNAAYASRLTWASDTTRQLEDQALLPLFGDDPVEMGLVDGPALIARLSEDAVYRPLFQGAFPGDDEPLTLANAMKALASFERTLISANSPYDRFTRGERGVLSAAARRGAALFFSERLECFHCHGGFNFSDSVDHGGLVEAERAFHNTGLYNVDGLGAYPPRDRGLMDLTGDPDDMGRFRAPSLRNIAVTAPYMHDGSIPDLDGVLDHYAAGGRSILVGPDAGDGASSPLKGEFVVGFVLSQAEREDVIAFLESLTDQDFLEDPRFSDPALSAQP